MLNPHSAPLPSAEGRKPYMRVIWPRAGTVERAYSLSSAVLGRLMHFEAGRTVPCLAGDAHCPWCQGHRQYWYGWLSGHSITWDCRCLIMLTESCVRRSITLRDPGVSLRGALIELSRPIRPANARVHALVHLDQLRAAGQVDEPDTLKHFSAFYGLPYVSTVRASLNVEDDQ